MDPPDSKDHFDPDFYNTPTTSIQGMLMLRAFCADFFEKSIRSSTTNNNPDEEHITSFLALILHSQSYFERARAVIPELQAPDSECSHPNHKVQKILEATRGIRGLPGKKWDLLPEESAWTDFAKEGMGNLARDFVDYGKRHQKLLSDASSHGSSINPTMFAPGKVECEASDSPSPLPKSVQNKPKSPPKKLDLSNIPTFVPRVAHDAMSAGELVWSPTSGTRLRRPDEVFHQSTKPHSTTPLPLQSGQGISHNATSSYSLKSQYLFHGSQDFSDSPPTGHRRSDSIRRSPPPQFKSTQSPLNPSAVRPPRSVEKPNARHRRHNRPGEMSFPHSLDRMMEMTTLGHGAHGRDSSSSNLDNTAYPVTNLSGQNSPSQFRDPRYPSSQARDIFGAEPFSAPPSVPGYGELHQTGQGMHGGPPSPFQSQFSRFRARSPDPFRGQLPNSVSRPAAGLPYVRTGQLPHVPSPEPRSSHSSRPHHGGSQNQPPNQIIQPVPQRMAQSQIPPFMIQAPPGPSNDALVVPPPGFMLPLDYWNMLHQREMDILTRLQHANRPMTEQERSYLHQMGEARVNAAASQLPFRGNMGKGKWLTELARTQRNVWRTGPDGTPGFFPPVIVARKQDFMKAIEREIALVESREGRAPGAGKGHHRRGAFAGDNPRLS